MSAQKRIEELINLINYHNEKYYNKDSPEIEDFEYDIATLDTLEMENGKKIKPEIKRKELVVIFPLEAQSPVYSGVLDAIFIELNELYGTEATIYYLEEAKV